MLTMIKSVLSKITFDMTLFEKELKKSIKWLNADEIQQLKEWCYDQFNSQQYSSVLERCFVIR